VTRYFVLAPDATAMGTTTNAAGPVIGVGPVTIPDYLDRKAIMTRVGPSEVNPSETHRWAQPLRTMLLEILAENLTADLGASPGLVYPWRRDLEPASTFELDLKRFAPTADGTAVLDAVWAVTTNGQVQHGSSALSEPVGGAGPDAQVAALSLLLGQLSGELAAAAGR
jgi:uncharacterized lipoprotein YmbA